MERGIKTPISGELQYKNLTQDASSRRTNDRIQDPDEPVRLQSHKDSQDTGVRFTLLPLVVLRGKYSHKNSAATLLVFNFDLTTPGALLSKGTLKVVFSGGTGIEVVGVAPYGSCMREVLSTDSEVSTHTLEIGKNLATRPYPMPAGHTSLDGCIDESDNEPPVQDTARWDFDTSKVTVHTMDLRGAVLCKHSLRAVVTATLTVDAVAKYTYNDEPVERRFITQTIFRPDEHRTHHEEDAPHVLENMSTLIDNDDHFAFQNNVNSLPLKH